MAAEKMKPCPFCGVQPICFKGIHAWYIHCINNKYRHHVTVDGKSRADAVRNWNRRPNIKVTGATIAQHAEYKICPECDGHGTQLQADVEPILNSLQQLKAEILPSFSEGMEFLLRKDFDNAVLWFNKVAAKLSAV